VTLGDQRASAEQYDEVLAIIGDYAETHAMFDQTLAGLAVSRHLLGETEAALDAAIGTEIPFRTPGSVSLYRHYLPLVRAALGRDEARRARDEGQSMSLDAALSYASEGFLSS
jgi:hypothetical protein